MAQAVSSAARVLATRQPVARHCTISCSTGRSAAAQETSRRAVLLGWTAAGAAALLLPGQAHAGVAEEALRSQLRPDIDAVDAVVKLLDARGALLGIKDIAVLPSKSEERRATWSYVPTYARRLREVGKAAPVVVALVTGAAGKEAVVSAQFGGDAGATSAIDPLFATVGQVLNYSGRGVRDEALAGPEAAQAALAEVERLLGQVPPGVLAEAKERRAALRAFK